MEADCVFIDAFWQFALRLRCLDSFMCCSPSLVPFVFHLSTYFSILIAAVNAIINYYSNHQADSSGGRNAGEGETKSGSDNVGLFTCQSPGQRLTELPWLMFTVTH